MGYTRNMYYRTRPVLSFGGPLTPAIKWLLIVNVGIFLLQHLPPGNRLVVMFGLVPWLVWEHLYVWQIFTYQFLHGGIFHLLFNMLALWMFGSDLERRWGSSFFLKYYWICVIGGGICTLLFLPNAAFPTIGASAGIYGVLLAFALLYPNQIVYFYFLFPIKMKYFVLIIGAIAFFSSLTPGTSGIAHLAHLGGMVFGFVYLRWGSFLGPRRLWFAVRHQYDSYRLAKLKRRFRVIEGNKKDDTTPTLH